MTRDLCLIAAVLLGGLGNSSAAAQSSPTKDIRFEVLSIRPMQPGAALSMSTKPTPNGYVATLSIWQAIMLAYVTTNNQEWNGSELLNTPNWIGEFYNINARVSQADLNAWQGQSRQGELLRAAMRAALKERCKLSLHEQPAEGPNWELTVAKNGPRLKPAVATSDLPAGSKFESGGVMVQTVVAGKQVKDFRAATTGDLIWFLGILSSGVPVRDKTSLTRRYDFTVSEVEPLPDDRSALSKYPIDHLGLKLKPGKESRPLLVIDHIEKPSAN